MKLRLLIQIAVVVSIVLLCTGFGVYSFLRLNSVENRQDFNLYTFAPGAPPEIRNGLALHNSGAACAQSGMSSVGADVCGVLPAALALVAGSVCSSNAQTLDGAGCAAFTLDQLHMGDDHQVGSSSIGMLLSRS